MSAPRPLLISAKGAPRLHLHIHSSQSVSLLFSLFVPVFPLSLSLWGFNILSAWQSVCINRGFCHTPPLVCDRIQPPSFFLSFSHSLHLWLFFPQPGSPFASLYCTLFYPSSPRFSCCSPSSGSPPSISHAIPLSLHLCVCLAKQLELCNLFSVAALWTFTASLLLSKSGTFALKITNSRAHCSSASVHASPCMRKCKILHAKAKTSSRS